MTPLLVKTLLFTAAPVTAMVVGGMVASHRPPTPRVGSYLQHFAAGVVFAALAVELLPDVIHNRAPVAAVIGFALGTALMLGIRQLTEKTAAAKAKAAGSDAAVTAKTPIGLLTTVGVDIAIDGLLIGIGFAAGAKTGVLITIALTLELLSLGLAVSAELGEAGTSRDKAIGLISGLALLVLAGATAGATLLSGLKGGALEAVLSFGCAALLYLVTEELLVEAHEVPETPFTTATFFIGFLLLLVIDMVS